VDYYLVVLEEDEFGFHEGQGLAEGGEHE
jgi:hypothetical protein